MASAEGKARLEQRASFDFGFALIFLCALHGFSALKVLAILLVNFSIATRLPRNYIPVATWIFNIGILFANELCQGYKYAAIADFLSPIPASAGQGESLLHAWGAWLDSHGGIMSRWEVLFNLTVLRLISFNLDYYWSLDRRAGSPIEVRSSNKMFTFPVLIALRRNNSTLPISQSETASLSQLMLGIILSATTSHMPSTHPYISQDPS